MGIRSSLYTLLAGSDVATMCPMCCLLLLLLMHLLQLWLSGQAPNASFGVFDCSSQWLHSCLCFLVCQPGQLINQDCLCKTVFCACMKYVGHTHCVSHMHNAHAHLYTRSSIDAGNHTSWKSRQKTRQNTRDIRRQHIR